MIKIFRNNNFDFTHEREGVRMVINALNSSKSLKEEVHILLNIQLPEVVHKREKLGEVIERTLYNCSPDMIVIKKDSICVVEMKSHVGTIDFPLNRSDTYVNEWVSDISSTKSIIINEGKHNPYKQVNNNAQAFEAYLASSGSEILSNDAIGSRWDLIERFILFTHPNVDFKYSKAQRNEVGNWFHRFHVGAVNETNLKNGEIFPDFISDMTTPVRVYKKDERSQILFDDESLNGLIKSLSLNDVTDEFMSDETDIKLTTPPSINTGVGLISIKTKGKKRPTNKTVKTFKPPEAVLKQPRELKLLSYFRRCLLQESQIGAKIDLSITMNWLQLVDQDQKIESIFKTGTPFSVSTSIPGKFQRNDPSLTYGFGLSFFKNNFGGKNRTIAQPLFTTKVNSRKNEQTGVFEFYPLNKNEIDINKKVIMLLPYFSELTIEGSVEQDLLDMEIENILNEHESTHDIIKAIYRKAGFLDKYEIEDYFQIYPIPNNPMPNKYYPNTSIVFNSDTAGVYKGLLNELAFIAKDWNSRISNNKPINDLAYKLLTRLEFPKKINWSIPLHNVGHLNYEQSMAIGTSMNTDVPITIVSGPPGTGKTQLAISLIAEANSKKQRVLFSSRNHKAVDILTDRYNSLFTSEKAMNRINKKGDAVTSSNSFNQESLTQKERVKNKAKLRDCAKKLDLLKKKIERFEEAVRYYTDVESKLEDLLQENPQLQIIDWFTEDSKILNINHWKKILNKHSQSEKRSESVFSKIKDVLFEDDFVLDDLFDQNKWNLKLSKITLDELKKSLTKDILIQIGDENDLIEFSNKYLSLLIDLDKLNKKLISYNKIIAEDNINDWFEEWNIITENNIDASIKIIDDQFLNFNNSPILNNAVTTLSASRLNQKVKDHSLKLSNGKELNLISTSKKLEPKPCEYDLAILDESSQTDLISAIPILFRSKRAVIIGDDKQLNPIVTTPVEKDFNLFKSYNFDIDDFDVFGYTQSSLLSFAHYASRKVKHKRIMLKEHFRSDSRIIGFSNYFFYEKMLRIKTKDQINGGIEWVQSTGDCMPKWSNPIECDIIIDKINVLLKNNEPSDIAIVTPFRKQADLINNKISQKFGSEVEKDLIAGTAHSFQGDERKIILFSIVAGKSMPLSTYNWIHKGHGKNLINVATTRAREKLYIVGDRNVIEEQGGLLKSLSEWVNHANNR